MRAFRFIPRLALIVALIALAQPANAQTRNASFVNPGAMTTKADGNKSTASTLVAEPASIDAGETLVNIARRVTVFFYNGFRSSVQINELSLNADGNVRSRVVSDDCKSIKTLPVGDKCSVALEITPSSPGPWTVELLLNHNGSGRIARAEINGTTLGKADEKSEGLSISKKIAQTLDFGDVKANEEKATRTMLIENDSPMSLMISAIDLISTRQDGLSIRANGCKEGDELKSGESCPITVLWEPNSRGKIATDLIVRHSGNLGFVVVPIRGSGTKEAEKSNDSNDLANTGSGKTMAIVPSSSASLMPRTSDSITQSLSSMPALDALPLPRDGLSNIKRKSPPDVKNMVDAGDGEEVREAPIPKILLIGTVGRRAILGDSQEQTYMVNLGEKINIMGSDVELLQLDTTRAVVMIGSKRLNLSLRNMQTIAYQNGSTTDEVDKAPASKTGKINGDSKNSKGDELPVSLGTGPGGSSSGAAGGTLPIDTKSTNTGSLTSQDVLNIIK